MNHFNLVEVEIGSLTFNENGTFLTYRDFTVLLHHWESVSVVIKRDLDVIVLKHVAFPDCHTIKNKQIFLHTPVKFLTNRLPLSICFPEDG